MQTDVYDMEGQQIDTLELPDDVFGIEVNKALLWESVKWLRASRHLGTHATKTRADVRGGGAKPLKQKGSGRARQGSTRAPHYVGGGTVFGPHPRSHAVKMNLRARRLALCSALSARASEQGICVVDTLSLDKPSTKTIAALLDKLISKKSETQKAGNHSVLVVDGLNTILCKSVRNLARATCTNADSLSIKQLLNHDKLLLTRQAVQQLTVRGRKRNRQRPAESNTQPSPEAAEVA